MKTMTMALAMVLAGAFAGSAEARGGRIHDRRHCDRCVKVCETSRWEQRTVVRTERVCVGEREEIVGWRDVWVDRTVTEVEMRHAWKRVLVGRSRFGRPVYEVREVCEPVPVCRTVRVLERQPVLELRPVYEERSVERLEWVSVPVEYWYCR